jgi:N-acetylmuramoyl-L-alanine amidase
MLWAGNTLTKALVQGDRLMLHFTHAVDAETFRTFRLTKAGSVRYVFDLSKTRLGSSRVPLGLRHPGVSSIRISQYRSNTVRIVVETPQTYRMLHGRRSARVYSIVLPRSTGKGKSIGQLFATVQTSSTHASASKPKPRSRQRSTPSKAIRKTKMLHSEVPTLPRHRYTIILDPGHGGHDSGAIGGRKREKDVVLQIGKRVRKDLQAMGFRVIMTRSSDRFVRLRNRTRYANRKHGDIFVSIHANSTASRKKRYRNGVETFFLQTTRSERAKRVAARENSVVLKRSDRLSKNVILNAVMTGPKIVLSNKLAIDVQRHILGNLRRKYRDVKDGGVRPAPFWVLVGAEMPAVLVETGYISNAKERKRLFTSRYQGLLAKGIAEGVANYLRNREREME